MQIVNQNRKRREVVTKLRDALLSTMNEGNMDVRHLSLYQGDF